MQASGSACSAKQAATSAGDQDAVDESSLDAVPERTVLPPEAHAELASSGFGEDMIDAWLVRTRLRLHQQCLYAQFSHSMHNLACTDCAHSAA
jgi:hypothetical protein